MALCECGFCGLEVRPGRRFISGHNMYGAHRGKDNPMYGKRGKESPRHGKRHTAASRQKMSEALSGENNPNYGKPRLPETRKKIGDAQRGELAHHYGKVHSEETKQKISAALSGDKNYRWKGEEFVGYDGRVWVHAIPGHPRDAVQTRATYVMEEKLGRFLKHGETVHHINFDPLDDHPDNLYLFATRADHSVFHGLVKRLGIKDHFQQWFSSEERESNA